MAADTADAGQYNGDALLVTVLVFLVLTWVSVALRTYVRAILTKSFQYDDWLMLVAQLNFTLSSAFIAAGLAVGLGHHNAVLPQVEEILAIKWQALATGTYISNMMFIKLSIGVFLLRLATQRRYKWIIWASMGIVASMSSVLFLWDIFQCRPVSAQWDYTIPSYTCVSPGQVIQAAYALSVLSIVSDWLYALLPIPMLWNAKMTAQAKATVSVVLGLGIFASVATLIRVKFLSDLTDTEDILYPMVWTLVEPGVAIVASSLVTIRPLLRRMRLKGFESSQSSRSRSRGFWARYGRSGGGGGNRLEGDKPVSSKRSRTASGMDVFEPDDIGLKDLEAARYGVAAGGGIAKTRKKGRGSSSRETTLTSQSSTREKGLGKSPGPAFGNRLSVSVREEVQHVEVDDHEDNNKSNSSKENGNDHNNDYNNGGDDDDDDDCISPIASWPLVDAQADSSSEGVFAMPGQSATLRGHVQNGKTMWRSETPTSPEEAEAIQGLRELPWRPGKEKSPFP